MQNQNWSYLGDHARAHPERAAVINGTTGASITYAELDQRSNRLAHYLHHLGLRPGEEGYLYLTDRKTFMIISGGVNIYPQAIEDALVTHPKVHDAGVIGVPDAEMGESVTAIIEPAPGIAPSAELIEELTAYLRGKVARYMIPKSIDFIDRMPRLPTGKLYKQGLREQFGGGRRRG